ncbi:NPP1 family protein [Nonomuraea sp. NPDC050451]|uniref:NPP1 family protein n=1 Tax=Nonomuraea sp. NPDC050451 TaxID=3364364 RepID=UPI00378A5424
MLRHGGPHLAGLRRPGPAPRRRSYFDKDRTVDGCGHRHDIEHIVVWVQNNAEQHRPVRLTPAARLVGDLRPLRPERHPPHRLRPRHHSDRHRGHEPYRPKGMPAGLAAASRPPQCGRRDRRVGRRSPRPTWWRPPIVAERATQRSSAPVRPVLRTRVPAGGRHRLDPIRSVRR